MAYISTGSEWTFELIQRYEHEIARIAKDFRLDTYPNQIEIITAEQMLDAYATVGLPIGYHHWSYGKHFLSSERGYKRGQMGLAYEIVINSNPCIAYLMEENSMTMQALTIAHASYGHNSFFKGNYLFRTWTSADAIVDYLLFARNYITECEQRYGEQSVELLLDSCHALMNYGVDRYKRPKRLSLAQEQARQKGVTITLEAPETLPLEGDEFRIEQVINNLLTNALRYGQGKPVAVTVTAADGEARVSVRDQGMGIAPEDQERIFEQFERTDGAAQVAGLGLGLYIARQIAQAHGGQLQVHSRPGEGAEFALSLPLPGARAA